MKKADTLFLLLKAELWQQSLPPGARLDRGFYRKLMDMAQKQTVDGLLGASLMNQNVRLDKYDLAETMMRTGRIGEKNSLMNKELAELCDLLTRHHIKFFVVKGQTIAAQYPHPENRVSGDIDFYCYPDDFDRCKAIIQDNWQVSIDMDEEEDEQHMHFDHNNVTYEMHFCLMKFSSRRNQSRVDEMIAQATLEHIDIEGVSVPVLPRSLNILYTFLHLYHHLIELGVGLRQFCDVAILLHHAAHDEECKDLLRRQLRKLGFTKAFAAIQAVLFDKLGLSQEAMVLPLSKCAWKYEKRILNIVFKRGNFGKYGRQTAVRSGWKYNLEAFSLKTNHYLSMFPLSPWENAAVLFKSLPAKIVKMALRKSE